MRTKPALAALLTTVAILIAATADVFAAPGLRPRPLDAGPDCYKVAYSNFGRHHPIGYTNSCNTLDGLRHDFGHRGTPRWPVGGRVHR